MPRFEPRTISCSGSYKHSTEDTKYIINIRKALTFVKYEEISAEIKLLKR
jgi:hypothetical protein